MLKTCNDDDTWKKWNLCEGRSRFHFLVILGTMRHEYEVLRMLVLQCLIFVKLGTLEKRSF